MYFLLGWPKSYRAPLKPENIVSIKYSPSYDYIAVVTASTLYIWSGDQHRIVLGYYHRSPVQISRDGENEDVYWRPSGHLALATRNGRIYFVDLHVDTSGVDLLQNPIEAVENPQPRLASKHSVSLTLRGTFLISPTGIAWIHESASKLYTCTHDGVLQRWTPTRDQFHLDEEIPLHSLSQISLRLLFTHGDGSKASQTLETLDNENNVQSLRFSANPTIPNNSTVPNNTEPKLSPRSENNLEDLVVMSIQFCSQLKLLVAAFQGGRAAVVMGKLESNMQDLKLFWLPVHGATVVAINATKHLISVGLNSGDVHLFHVEKHFQLIKVLTLTHWGITKRDTGAVRCLQWTHDGRVLAVGYAARGFSTWSSHGCRLNCTISQTNVHNETISSIQVKSQPTANEALKTETNEKTETLIPGNSASKLSKPPLSRNASKSSESLKKGSGKSSEIIVTPQDASESEKLDSKPKIENPGLSASPSPSINLRTSQTSIHNQPFYQNLKEAAKYGVSCLCWGVESYHLLTSSSHASKVGILDQYQFVKASIASNLNLNYCQRILLQGEDRLLMLVNRGKEVGALSWKHIQVPLAFLQDNWPLRLVSVSADGSHIVVSGKKGFVVYNCTTNLWQLFGDRAEEQALQCVGLSWYKHFIVTTIYSEALKTHQVLFFPRNNKLSFSSAVYRASVPQNRTPIFLDCNDSDLILFTNDSYFQYKIIVEGEPSNLTKQIVSLKLTHQVVLDVPFKPASILLLPSNVVMPEVSNVPTLSTDQTEQVSNSSNSSNLSNLSNSSTQSTPSTPNQIQTPSKKLSRTLSKLIVLDTHGNLLLTNAEHSVNLQLSHGIEQFWMANTEYMNDLGNTLWAYGERGLEVWFPFFTKTPTQNYLSRDQSLEFDMEICPIGFLHQWGIIVGVGQGTMNGPASESPCFELQTKTQPFLHFVLKRMLEKGEHHQAVHIAKQYSFLPHFTHTLELLLHESLEAQHELDRKKEVARRKKKKTAVQNTNPNSNSINSSQAGSASSTMEDIGNVPVTAVSSTRTSLDSLRDLQDTSSIIDHSNITSTYAIAHGQQQDPLTPSKSSPNLHQSGQQPSQHSSHQSSRHQTRKSNDKSSKSSHVFLRRVIDFLKEFGTNIYTSVVVACARKTDPGLWATLFNPRYNAGKPKALFEHCIESGKIIVAASYLRVIQFTDGEAESQKAAVKCLDLCLKLDDLELLRDLMRFLEPSTPNTPSEKDELNNLDIPVEGGMAANEHRYLQEVLLAKYARKLLETQQMRTLARFARITHRELRTWLLKEKKRAAIIEDYPAALATLHSQFNIPRPTHFPVSHLLRDLHFKDPVTSSGATSSSTSSTSSTNSSIKDYSMIYFPNSQYLESQIEEASEDPMAGRYSASDDDIFGNVHETSMIGSFKDLEYLLQEMVAADCVGWALVLGSILFRLSTLLTVLKKHPIFWRVYKPMLEEEESKGYNDLLQYIKAQLNLDDKS